MTASLTRIMLPTRFAVLSQRAAEYVQLLMSRFDAELHVVHVVPHTDLVLDTGMVAAGSMAMPIASPSPSELLAEADRKLAAFVSETLPEYADRARVFSVIGGVTDELVKHAHHHAIDLIVMGTNADGMLKRLVFGSVGKGTLEGAPCPVLLVPVRGAAR